MPDELRLSHRMLAFAQPRELLRSNRPLKSPLRRQLALPFAVALLVAAPVILLLGGELPRVVRPRLPRRERLWRDGDHLSRSPRTGPTHTPGGPGRRAKR